ncbi:hypothetical protein HDV00_006184 [Rhizophlyctis rosea]|nr:hypothetical protein HDV00_006184 [Rhizophlyctis rosea]
MPPTIAFLLILLLTFNLILAQKTQYVVFPARPVQCSLPPDFDPKSKNYWPAGALVTGMQLDGFARLDACRRSVVVEPTTNGWRSLTPFYEKVRLSKNGTLLENVVCSDSPYQPSTYPTYTPPTPLSNTSYIRFDTHDPSDTSCSKWPLSIMLSQYFPTCSPVAPGIYKISSRNTTAVTQKTCYDPQCKNCAANPVIITGGLKYNLNSKCGQKTQERNGQTVMGKGWYFAGPAVQAAGDTSKTDGVTNVNGTETNKTVNLPSSAQGLNSKGNEMGRLVLGTFSIMALLSLL